MARYRWGNAYLSEEEHDEQVSERWKLAIFFAVAIFLGMFINKLLLSFKLIKVIRFAIVLLVSLPSGYYATKISDTIRETITLTIILISVVFILKTIWQII